MASDRVPPDIQFEEARRTIQLERSAVLTGASVRRTRPGRREVLARKHQRALMVLAEQEFDRESGNGGIATERHNPRPGETTSVYVIRRGVAP